MKNLFLGLALMALLGTSLSSCTKTYHCHCTKVGGGEEEFEIKAKNKADAKSDCEGKAPTGSTLYTDCHLH